MLTVDIKDIAVAELENFGCSQRLLETLDRGGYVWLDELLGTKMEEVETLREFGEASKRELLRSIKKLLKHYEERS